MNVLSLDQRVKVISLLLEGCGVRTVARLTSIQRDTIVRLSRRVGRGCAILHESRIKDIETSRIEVDEIYAIVRKRENKVGADDPRWCGSQYTHIALSAGSRLIITYCVGKRTPDVTSQFIDDLQSRVTGTPEISSDGYAPYTQAVREFFGQNIAYGQVLKSEQFYTPRHKHQHLPREIAGIPVKKIVKSGNPQFISTNLVERQNLTLRMGSARFRRASTTISKTIESHVAAVALYVGHYNFCRVHESLKTSPAVAQGLEEKPWSLEKLVTTALELTHEQKKYEPHFEEVDMSRWFRFYDDAINDPKILKLSDKLHRVWVGLLCVASKNDGQIPSLDDCALMIRMKPEKLAEAIKSLIVAGLIDNNGPVLSPHNWNARQFKSDVSTERVKRFRKQERNVSETPPDTEQIQKQKDSEADASGAEAPTDPPVDHRKRLFSEGLAALARISGKGPDSCRSFVGKCLKAASDDAVTVLGLIEDAERNQTVNPTAWIISRLQTTGNPHGRRTVHDAARDLTQRLQALDEPAPAGLCEPAGGGTLRLLPPR